MDEEYFTPRQVADRLKVSLSLVRRWCYEGEIASVKIGPRLRRIPASAVNEMVTRNSQPNSAA